MSISPPSDIVLDVARAADPTRRAEATRRLARLAHDGVDLDRTLSGAAGPSAQQSAAPGKTMPPPPDTMRSDAAKAYRGFEGMVLATFVEAAFPESVAAFGAGTAGSVWRSMLAEQIGAEMAAAGIGIADRLAASSLVTRTVERGFLAAVEPQPTYDTES